MGESTHAAIEWALSPLISGTERKGVSPSMASLSSAELHKEKNPSFV